MNKQTVYACIFLALLIVAILSVVLERNDRKEISAEAGIYVNDVYGYSFGYPEDAAVMQYSPERAAVGTPAEGGFAPSVHAEVVRGDAESFEAFVVDAGKRVCSAQSPISVIFCEKTERINEYESKQGATGIEVYLDMIDRRGSQERRLTFGPLFAFDVSSSTTDTRYSALIVYRPVSVAMEEAKLRPQDVAQFISLD